MEGSVGAVVHIQAQPLDDLGHQSRGLEGEYLVVDVGVGLEEIEVAEHSGGIGDGTSRPLLELEQQRGGARVDRRRGQKIEHRHSEHHHEGKNEPSPLREAQIEEVLNAHRVFVLFELDIVVLCCHFV